MNAVHTPRSTLRAWILFAAIAAALTATGCATVLTAVSDEDGIQQDPTDRTLGAVIDDELIESTATVNIRRSSPGLAESHVNVTSFNGVVLLTGQVRAESLRVEAEEVVLQLKSVRRVYNELQVEGPTSLLTRSGDSWVTTKVKTRLLADENVPGAEIKVVTENGVVYLLGLVNEQDADAAAEIARTTGGVRRVVRMFEYVETTSPP